VTAPIKPAAGYKRIATEEAWAPPELIAEFRRLIDKKLIDERTCAAVAAQDSAAG
jgi:hypothetical protein